MTVGLTAVSQGDSNASATVFDISEVLPVAGAAISPGTNQGFAEAPDEIEVVFTHSVTNTGNFATSFGLTATNSIEEWPAATIVPSETEVLNPGESMELEVTVIVPAGTPSGTVNNTIVRVLNIDTGTQLAQAENVTAIGPLFDFIIEPPVNTGTVLPNSTTIFTHTITNIGINPDSYQLTGSDSNGWAVSVAPILVDLGPGQTTEITVTIQTPQGLLAGTAGFSRVTARSNGNPNLTRSGVEQTTVAEQAGLEFSAPQVRSILPSSGQVVFDALTIINRGNIEDSFTLEIEDDLNWQLSLTPTTVGPLAGLGFGVYPIIDVRVQVPPVMTLGTINTVRVTAISQLDPSVRETIELRLIYRPIQQQVVPLNNRLYLPMVRQ